MGNDMDTNVLEVVADLKVARRAFLEAVEISVSDAFPDPASEEDIVRLETQFGQHFPPSYRSFLLIQDGFSELDGETNVLSINEMISFFEKGSKELLNHIAEVSGENYIRNCIVFGRSDQSASAFLFNPGRKNDDGEWTVIEYDEEEGVDASHESFLNFLKACIVEAREAEQETNEGKDLLDEDF